MDHGARLVFRAPDVVEGKPSKVLPGHAPTVLPPGQLATTHKPPPLFGLGLLELVPDEAIRGHCDPDDRDGDGVRGKTNVAFDGRPGRFGFKAHTSTVEDFIASALLLEMGVTNPLDRNPDTKTDTDGVPDPEVPADVVRQIAAYVRGLAPPPRQGTHPVGEGRFAAFGCATCHKPDPAPAARGAYTDLCVHKMGKDFDNGMTDLQAGPDEWRTAPLWGLRLRSRYFHDDRAASVDEAIRMHGGEASRARDRYVGATEAERAELLAFLATL